MAIFNGRNKNGEAIVSYRKVIDLKASDNLKFYEIARLWGQNLVEFHHELLQKQLPGMESFDMSNWHHFNGTGAKGYYPYFLALFMCHGVLFENFVIFRLGLIKGGIVMMALSLLACVILLRFYDWSKRDWLGIETIKGMKDYQGGSTLRRFTAWILRRSEPVVFLFLSIHEDAFITLTQV
jgi:hypothetical protein